MTFKVATGDYFGRATHWWAKFLAYSHWDDTYSIQDLLDSYNSKATSGEYWDIGDTIEFESEADFTMFVLRWA